MKEKYYDQAVACVKDHVLPAQIKLYRSCDGDLDRVYGEAVNGNGYHCYIIIMYISAADCAFPPALI